MSYHIYAASTGGGSPFWADAVDNFAALPITGIIGEAILVKDTGVVYYWTGVAWMPISAGPASNGNLTESTSSVLTITGGTGSLLANASVEVKKASLLQDGYLSSADFSTFNAKQPAGSYEVTTNKGVANGYASLDSSALVPITQIPPAALERLVIVADQAARFALTTATVQNGDTVKQVDINEMFFVKDDTQLNNAAGYEVYSAGTASSVAWSGVTGTPNTLAGYGITDATKKVIPSTNQRVFVNYLTGSDLNDGSYAAPFKSVQAALSSITDATQNKPYTIFLGANRQIETGDVFLKPYVFIVGDVQRATYFRVNGGQLKPSADHATTSSWTGLANLYFGGSSTLNWDLQALGGSNCTFLLQNVTMSGPVIFKGRNAGGGDFVESYVGLELNTLSLDSMYFQVQSMEIGGDVSITNTQAVAGLSGTFRNVCFDGNLSIDATGGAITTYLEQNNFCTTSNTITTIGSVAIQADAAALPPVSRQVLSVGTTVTIVDDISNDKYVPATPANWSVAPAKSQAALDTLAADLKAKAISNLADTLISTPVVDDMMFYNGTKWVNRQKYTSAGCLSVPTFTNNGAGSITVHAHAVSLWDNAVFSGQAKMYNLAEITVTLTDLVTSYVIGDYNAGSPVMRVTTDVNEITESDIIPMFTIYRNGIYLHQLNWDTLGRGLPNKIHQSIVKTQRYRRESGLAISESGTRNVNLTGGIVWVGANKVILDAIASATDNIFFWYHVAGVWTQSLVTQYNNTQYDNGTALQTLTNGRYAVNWLYRGVENPKHLYTVLGTQDYQLPAAQTSQPPVLPPAISSHAVLVGRIIVVKNAATATQIDSSFDTVFSTASISNHNDLSGLQGGTTNEYYHLTSSEYSKLEVTDVESKNANFTAATKKTYLVDTSSIAISVQLPAPVLNMRITIKDFGFNAHINNITLLRAGTEKIEGIAASYTIDSDGASVRLISNGTDWAIV